MMRLEGTPMAHDRPRSPLIGPIIFLCVLGLVLGALFLRHPGIDLWISSAFADGAKGFDWRFHPMPRFFNDLINLLAALMAVFTLGGLGLSLRLKMPIAGLYSRHYGFLLACLVTGPGLIANGLFKENWGRARPRNIEMFGGGATFSPPLLISDQCASNCSFVSGDASMGFFFLALALVAPAGHRKISIVAALSFGSFIGFMRILQGAHFLSDVVFAGLFVCLTVLGLAWVFLEGWQKPTQHLPTLGLQLGLAGSNRTIILPGKSKRWMFFRASPNDLGADDTITS
jgi:lipid A 4'-phosphatase